MFSTGYVGGTGTEFFTDYSNMKEYNSGTKSRHKSIFAMLAAYSDVEYAIPVDITGKYSGDTEALNVEGKLRSYCCRRPCTRGSTTRSQAATPSTRLK
jgi:hypothetical protein